MKSPVSPGAGRGKIQRVEISTDDGKTWKDAELQQPVLSKAFTRFRCLGTGTAADLDSIARHRRNRLPATYAPMK